MTTTLRTSCTRDCPDACGLVATVEDGRITRLSGDPNHPVTRGFLCYRVGTHYLDRHYSTERLTTPLLREGDRFLPISFERAIELAANQLARIRSESGGAAILKTQGGGSLGLLKNLNAYFGRLLGATETSGDVCDGAGSYADCADFGATETNSLADLDNARAIILWGKNPANSSPHLTPHLSAARKRGARLVVIDPLATRVANLADLVLKPRPGGDGALALGVARLLLERGAIAPELRDYAENVDAYFALLRSRSLESLAEEADLPLRAFEQLAEIFQKDFPVTTLVGWGMQRRRNGATLIREINALHALTGNVGIPGGGASFSVKRRKPFDLSFLTALESNVPRTLPVATLGPSLLRASDPPIRAVIVDNHNPVASNPESLTTAHALRSREFTLVLDSFLTDTAQCAHLVIPTTTMLEEDELVGSYGHHFVSAARAVVPRLPGTHTDLEIYQALADRLGFGEALAGSPAQWMDRMLGKLRASSGGAIDREALLAGAWRDPLTPDVAFRGRVFATPTRKFHFVDRHLPPPTTDPEFPLRFQPMSTNRWQGSQLTIADEQREGPLKVTVHPETARGLADGARAILRSRLGALEVVVEHDPNYRRDTVYAPRARSVALGHCVNAILAAELTDFGEGAAYCDQGVRLEAPTD